METSVIDSHWVGQVVDGRFTLLEWLGGTERTGVFRTEIQEGSRTQPAAIKIIRVDAAEADARLAELAASLRLSHPHLMASYHCGRCEIGGIASIYLVTEYAGEILSQVLPERPIAPHEANQMLGPVMDALGYLHRNGFVHGHLKPSNILVVDDRLKISADGLCLAGRRRRVPSTLDVYDAPELAASAVSPAADLWSLGVTLVEALTQDAPIIDKAAKVDPEIPESIPEPFATIARHCLRRDPSRRWRLDQVKAHLEPGGADAVPVKAEETDRSKPGNAAILGAALVVVLAIAAVLFWPHKRPAQTAAPEGAGESAASTAAPAIPDAAETGHPAARNAEPRPAAPAKPSPSQAASAPPPAPPPAGRAAQGLAGNGEVAQRILPDVPGKAMQTIDGKVMLAIRVAVDRQGAVSSATLASHGQSKYFAKFALEASRKWKFAPPQSNGQPVESVWTLRYEFRRSGIGVTAHRDAP